MCFCLHFWPVSAYRFFLRLWRRWGWSGTPHQGFFIHLQVKEKEKSKLHKEFGKKIPKNSGGDWKTSERRRADPKKGSVLPLSGLSSLRRAVHPTSAGNPHTSAHQNHFIFPFGNTDFRSGSPYAWQELNDDNATRDPNQNRRWVCPGINLTYHLLDPLSIW